MSDETLAQVVALFIHQHPMLNRDDLATHLLALIWISHHHPELVAHMDAQCGSEGYFGTPSEEDEYPKHSHLLRET